ncbi:MAG TPA: TonB-dependent receptor [Vicinamibacteria bacterium]|nr:TonB-dependent receptor [Vicinamibacteria bacterium]
MRTRVVVWASCVAASVAGAQEARGRLAGSVTSPDRARLPGVVLVVSRADGWSARLSTGSLGTFRSGELLPGTYEVRASLPGFEERVAPGVIVRPGEEERLDLSLEVAGFREAVSVVGEAPRGTLEASQIRELSAVDLGEALGWKAGLWRLRKGGIANDVVLRGLQSRDLDVLVDGQRVYGACPNHMDPATFHVDLAEVDRVEVGLGPFDVKNQGALGGTVNVVTRKPESGWHATPTFATGSSGFVNPSLVLGRGGERVSALAGYSYRASDPFRDGAGRRFTELANYRPEDQGDRAFSIGTAWGRVVWAPAAGHQVDLAYTRQDSGAVLYPYLQMDALSDDTDRVNVRYEATGLGRRKASVRAQGYFTQVDHWMTDERRASSLAKPRAYSMGTRADTRTAGGKVEAVLSGLTVGAEGYERRWNATNEMAGSAYVPQAMVPDVTVRVAGAFAEYLRPLGRGILLSAGARIDEARSEADPARANLALYEAYQGTRSLTGTDTLPAGKVRLAWRRGAVEIAGGVGHAARAPEANERYLALRRMGTDWVGNPELRPSRNTSLDASAAFTRAGFRAELSVYHSRVTDYVTVYDQARRSVVPEVMNAMARSFANVDATLTGGELAASLPVLFARVFVSGDVSCVRGSQDGDGGRGIAAGPLAEMPPLRGRLSARYDDGRLFGAVEGLFAADQERVDASLGEARTPGWGVMNLSAGLRRGRLRLTAGVANVFDRLYTDHLSYQRDPFRSGVRVPEPGRSLFANASFRF